MRNTKTKTVMAMALACSLLGCGSDKKKGNDGIDAGGDAGHVQQKDAGVSKDAGHTGNDAGEKAFPPAVVPGTGQQRGYSFTC